jgi:hypothetical protein
MRRGPELEDWMELTFKGRAEAPRKPGRSGRKTKKE